MIIFIKITSSLLFVSLMNFFAGHFTYTNDASGNRISRSFSAQKMNPQGSDSLTKTMLYWDEIAGSGAKGYKKGDPNFFDKNTFINGGYSGKGYSAVYPNPRDINGYQRPHPITGDPFDLEDTIELGLSLSLFWWLLF
ncbi:MAG: hypothetical protein NT007_16335 [Candidatus Kapabacteria bacterium]|nr:hypothetical protein [Candidatus Kapabacteria bacterium]